MKRQRVMDSNLCNAPCRRPTHSVRQYRQQQHTLQQQLGSCCTGGGGGWDLDAIPTPPADLTAPMTRCDTRSALWKQTTHTTAPASSSLTYQSTTSPQTTYSPFMTHTKNIKTMQQIYSTTTFTNLPVPGVSFKKLMVLWREIWNETVQAEVQLILVTWFQLHVTQGEVKAF